MSRILLSTAALALAALLTVGAPAGAAERRADGARASEAAPAEVSAQRRWYGRRHVARRAVWGPRRAFWGPRRYGYWGRPYWRTRHAYWGPRYRYWRPRYAYWGPGYGYYGSPYAYGYPYYWRPRPVISIGFGFGPRWWW
jgi:hypothetical protein